MITTEQLSENLLAQIKNIVDGNQVTSNDVQPITQKSEIFNAHLTVNWKFKGEYSDSRVAGGQPCASHFLHSTHFEHETQKYLHDAVYEKSLRQHFLDNLTALHCESLKESDEPYRFHSFTPFSLHETCSSCGGKGKKRCSSCGGSGRQTCSGCGGSGRTYYTVTSYDNRGNANGTRTESRACSSCSGGKITCSGCSGRGMVRCSPCEGCGYFTIIRAVYAVAVPAYRIGTNARFAKDALETLLNRMGTQFCQNKIAFDEMRFTETADDQYQFEYDGESFLLEQDFNLKGKTYQIYAFSNPPYPFVKPMIFDDLFSDELAFLKETTSAKGNINKRKAFEFFVRYSGQPALEQAMREIAKHRTATTQILGEKLEQACHGYISSTMAEELSGYLNKIMDKVSPTYSSVIWGLWAIIASISGFILAEERFEMTFSYSPIGTVIGVIVTLLLAYGIISIAVWLLSSVAVLLARRKIPKEYRQKMRHKEPFKRTLKILSVATLLGAIYGYATTQNWVPKWNSVPTNWIKTQLQQQKIWFCPLSEKINWQTSYCVTQPTDAKTKAKTTKPNSK